MTGQRSLDLLLLSFGQLFSGTLLPLWFGEGFNSWSHVDLGLVREDSGAALCGTNLSVYFVDFFFFCSAFIYLFFRGVFR